MRFVRNIRLDGFLSFPPASPTFELAPLNVLIGPNGAGKSNLIEAFELLAATPTDTAAAIRDGGGAEEWLWKGDGGARRASIEVVLDDTTETFGPLRYALGFGSVGGRAEVFDEVVEETKPRPGHEDVYFYYRFQQGHPAINVREESGSSTRRRLQRQHLPPDQSVLARYRSADLYPEVAWVADFFDAIQTFREWPFGRYAPLRQPQRTDLSGHRLAPDSRNLALLLNRIEHENAAGFHEALERFLPRFKRMSTYVRGGVIEFFLHETGFASPTPATRLSDGTIRFMAILATLLNPTPPPLVCIEEPELGIHPDAVLDLGPDAGRSFRAHAVDRHDTFGRSGVGPLQRRGIGRGVRTPRHRNRTAAPRPRRACILARRVRPGRRLAHGRSGREPVTGICLFMEGGGRGAGRAALRRGMDAFLRSAKAAARRKRLTWKVIACGPRNEAFRLSVTRSQKAGGTWSSSLWIRRTSCCRTALAARGGSPCRTESGQAPVRQGATREHVGPYVTEEQRCWTEMHGRLNAARLSPRAARNHLKTRDGWGCPGDVSEDRVQLMVRTMETWLIADVEALRSWYGKGFKGNKMPGHPDLERVPKESISSALAHATRRTRKGEYHKIRHASELLALVDPGKVRQRCRHCERLFRTLTSEIEAA